MVAYVQVLATYLRSEPARPAIDEYLLAEKIEMEAAGPGDDVVGKW